MPETTEMTHVRAAVRRRARLASGSPAGTAALLYLRVSAEVQRRTGVGLAVQRERCTRYATDRGWTIEGIFQDVMSGRRGDRAGHQQLLAAVRAQRARGRTTVVVVEALDRLGRALLEGLRCLQQLRALDVAVHSVRDGGTLPKLVTHILLAMAQEEVRQHGERIRAANQHIRESAIRCMLANGVYIGRQPGGGADVFERPVGRWPPLLDEALWSRVRATFTGGKAPRHAPNGPPQLLSGLLRCPRCTGPMEPLVASGRGRRRYRCAGLVRPVHEDAMPCQFGVGGEAVERLVLERVDAVLRDFRARRWRAPKVEEPSPSEEDRAVAAARERWARAAEGLVDGRIGRHAYQRAGGGHARPWRTIGWAGRRRGADRSGGDDRSIERTDMFVRVRTWRQVLATGDPTQGRGVLRELLEGVVPVRTAMGGCVSRCSGRPSARASSRRRSSEDRRHDVLSTWRLGRPAHERAAARAPCLRCRPRTRVFSAVGGAWGAVMSRAARPDIPACALRRRRVVADGPLVAVASGRFTAAATEAPC